MRYVGDWLEWTVPTLLVGVVLLAVVAFVLLFGLAVIDSVQEYRAFDAQAACQAQRMVPIRRSLSARVVCVPAITRNDTLTLGELGR